jgi:hypothetical protein
MKYYTAAIVLIALLGDKLFSEVSAVKVSSKFTDDLMKSLAEDL